MVIIRCMPNGRERQESPYQNKRRTDYETNAGNYHGAAALCHAGYRAERDG